MTDPIRITSVVGARPQFVKLAPIARAIGGHDAIEHRIVHTGQHYDQNMSATFFEQLQIPPPDVDLGVGSGSHGEQTAAMLVRLEAEFGDSRPDAVIVYGDTNSTLAATLAAVKIHVPVIHVEAGLRSFDRTMPEEVNRLVADHCADRLYAPTPLAMKNLEEEGIADRAVLSGDVMHDAVLHNAGIARQQDSLLENLSSGNGKFGLVTVHRPVNTTGPSLTLLLNRLEQIADEHLPLVFPVHPRTRAVLAQVEYSPGKRLTLLEPVPYLDSLRLIEAAAVVITDSGGVQKEAAFLRTPCVTIRKSTEWEETVDVGVNRLVPDIATGLVESVIAVLQSESPFNEDRLAMLREQYGDGRAAEFIVKDSVAWLGERAASSGIQQ